MSISGVVSGEVKSAQLPSLRRETKRYDVVVAGAGLAGIGAAVTAARHGAKVALIQDRPVLGGNASKEIRVCPQGGSGGRNSIFFRETGLMEEIQLENQYRNPEGDAEIWDTVLLEIVLTQPNLDLFLNTTVFEVAMAGDAVRAVSVLTLQAEILTTFEAAYFIDCTGDGTLAYLAGAPFMSGRESRADFGESMAPAERKPFTHGSTILFVAHDAGKEVEFHAPAFAYKFDEKDFRRDRNPTWEFKTFRGQFWWIEWGGTLDTIHDNEAIKLELLKIAYGVFDWLKNAPQNKQKNANMSLEWFGSVPGKRESRRFIGDHILTQQDVIERPAFPDAVAYGGWNLDDHAPRGFWDDEKPPSFHTELPGLYSIPLRCLYSRKVPNLFFAGRNASLTHIAFTAARVMLTCAQMGEAAGAAAALCLEKKITPRTLAESAAAGELQQRLLRDDHYIIGVPERDAANLARRQDVRVTASSQEKGIRHEAAETEHVLDGARMVLFPVKPGPLPWIEALLSAKAATKLAWQLHRPDGSGLTIPAEVVASGELSVGAGERQWVRIPVCAQVADADFHMLELKANPALTWHTAFNPVLGFKSLFESIPDARRHVDAHSRFALLDPKRGAGKKAPQGHCVRLPEDPRIFAPENVVNGFARPFKGVNAWVSQETDFARPEWLELAWSEPVELREVEFRFDSKLDRHFTSFWTEARYRIEPTLIRDYDVDVRVGGVWRNVASVIHNRRRRCVHKLETALRAEAVRLVVKATNGTTRAHVFEVRVYGI